MSKMQLDQIWTYPVKSMLGARIEAAEIASNGIVGDRMWTLRDEQRGAIASARTIAGLSRMGASVDVGVGPDGTDVAVIHLPDGSSVSSFDSDAAARLSSALDHPVTLWAKQAAESDFYRKGPSDGGDVLTHIRAIFGRVDDEPLPDFSIFPPEMMTEFEYPPGNFFDCYPLMIMSTSAVRSLREALPDSTIDERRFRPSIVVDTGDDQGHPEFDWTGLRLRVGGAELQIGAACPRCVAITREFAENLPADRSVLRHVVRDLDQNVGVYATVIRGGPIRVGDSVELV